MTKHLAGIILFTFIIGSSAIIAGLFYQAPEAKIITVRENFTVYKKKKRKSRCRKRRPHTEKASVNLSAAIFDSSANRLTAIIDFEDNRNSYGEVDLNFFVNDKYGIRFLKTERIYVSSPVHRYTKILDWLGRLDSRENLYVIPQIHNEENDKWSSPVFNSYEAIPVLPIIN
ncbi:MAG: hypothetical protein ACR2MD_08175 [Aridibacter sp.]